MLGIITFHRAINYGGILQTYALQKFLYNIGIDNEILDYRCKIIENAYNPVRNAGSPVKNLLRLFCITPVLKNKNKRFYRFIKRNMKLSKMCISLKELKEIEQNYSSFISGSDQVFTNKWTEFDPAYFLSFTNETVKKNSYAASFGSDCIPEHLKKQYVERLSSFESLSVREESAKILIGKLLKKEAMIHIDPTFLLDSDDWGELCPTLNYKNYLLLYTLGEGEHVQKIINVAREIAQKKKKKILYINDKFYKIQKGIRYLSGISPEKFIALFKNADYVVTNSFHGSAFSIIFNRNFITTSDMPNGLGTRIENLLYMFHLEKRDNRKFGTSHCYDSINWEIVNGYIKMEQNKSMDYLLKISKGNFEIDNN